MTKSTLKKKDKLGAHIQSLYVPLIGLSALTALLGSWIIGFAFLLSAIICLLGGAIIQVNAL